MCYIKSSQHPSSRHSGRIHIHILSLLGYFMRVVGLFEFIRLYYEGIRYDSVAGWGFW